MKAEFTNFTLRSKEGGGCVLCTDDGLAEFPTFSASLASPGPEEPAQEKVTRETVLDAAKRCVCGDREQDYGSPENNFRTIASMWNSYLCGAGLMENHDPTVWKGIKPKDAAAMLALLKIARIASGHAKADNWIDLAGYAACGGELEAANE